MKTSAGPYDTFLVLHVTSSPPFSWSQTQGFSLASFVYSTNMAAKPLYIESLWVSCKPSIPELFQRPVNSKSKTVMLHLTRAEVDSEKETRFLLHGTASLLMQVCYHLLVLDKR